jgi:hypothetical protein
MRVLASPKTAKAGVVVHAYLSASHGDVNGHGTAQGIVSGMARIYIALFLLHYERTE